MSSPASPAPPGPPLDTLLFDGPRLRVGSFRVAVDDPRFRDSGPIHDHLVVFPRTPVYIRHREGDRFYSDSANVNFYNRGQVYYREPVDPEGDRCDWFAFAPRAIEEALAPVDPAVEDRPERPFTFAHLPGDERAYLLQRLVVRHLSRAERADELFVEEVAFEALRRVFAGGRPRASRPADRGYRSHRELAESARALLAERYAEPLSLGEIAAALDASAYHLCRVFRERIGTTIHRYRTGLRLRASLERLADSSVPITEIALDAGFSSHSHFSNVFRRAFGTTPSRFREGGRPL